MICCDVILYRRGESGARGPVAFVAIFRKQLRPGSALTPAVVRAAGVARWHAHGGAPPVPGEVPELLRRLVTAASLALAVPIGEGSELLCELAVFMIERLLEPNVRWVPPPSSIRARPALCDAPSSQAHRRGADAAAAARDVRGRRLVHAASVLPGRGGLRPRLRAFCRAPAGARAVSHCT